jgi:putative membrane protein
MKVHKTQVLWGLFLLSLLLGIIGQIGNSFKFGTSDGSSFYLFSASIPILLLLLHSAWTLGFRRALVFILVAGTIGFVFEVVGLDYGTFFGGQYVYHSVAPTLAQVPIMVMLYWAVFIYTGYSITNSFLFYRQIEKPNRKTHRPGLLILLLLMDGIIVTAIDIFMDPIKVREGSWTWLGGGQFFGVPLENFLGWFVITIIVTGLFRLYEYFSPQKFTINALSVFLMPIFGYVGLVLFFTITAIKFHLLSLIAIGGTLMLGIVVVNLIFLAYETSKPKNQIIFRQRRSGRD